MNEEVAQLQEKIDGAIAEIVKLAEHLSKLQPVSHKSKSAIQWTGGIPGAIREFRENNRLFKLIKAPIYNELSFFEIPFHLIEVAGDLVQNQLKIQSLLSPEDTAYYGNIKSIIEPINLCIDIWYNYSPDMATEGLTIGNEKNVSLLLSVQEYTKEEFVKLDLPGEYECLKTKAKDASSNGGCFGVLVGLITISGGLISLVIFLLQC